MMVIVLTAAFTMRHIGDFLGTPYTWGYPVTRLDHVLLQTV